MGYILTNTPIFSNEIPLKINESTHKFNAYSGSNRRSTHKTQNASPQNRSAAGFTYALKQPKCLISNCFWA